MNQTVLTSSIQVATNRLTYGSDGQQPASLRLAGVVLNDKGKIAHSFKNQLKRQTAEWTIGFRLSSLQRADRRWLRGFTRCASPRVMKERARRQRHGVGGDSGPDEEATDLEQFATRRTGLGQSVPTKMVTLRYNSASIIGSSRSSHLPYWVFVYNARRDCVRQSKSDRQI